MQRLSRSVKALARADRLIAAIWLAVVVKRAVLLTLAALIAALGVGMLDLAGYFALQPRVGATGAALCVAGADFAIAAILALAASLVRPGRDLDLALELHDQAAGQVRGLVTRPFSLVGSGLVGSVAALLLRLAGAALKPKGGPDAAV